MLNYRIHPDVRRSSEHIDFIQTDFRNADDTNQRYNKWVAARTKGALPQIRASFAPNTKMVMSSAVYFRGSWRYKFNPSQPGLFTDNNQRSIRADMMTLRKKLQYGKLENMGEWLSIPYDSKDDMIIILPHKSISVDQLIANLNSEVMKNLLTALSDENYANVNVTLPKFKIDSSFSLVQPLNSLGIKAAFSPDAEIHRLLANEPITLSNAVQTAQLQIDEEGTIATSITSFSVVALSFSPPVPDVEFNVNRPFVAMIVDRIRGFPYFMAKVSSPLGH